MELIYPALTLGIMGGLFGIALQFASNMFHVDVDPRITEVESVLPGANCGACGHPGCAGMATAIVNGEAPVNGCPVGGQEVADKVAEIMGVSAGSVEKNVACVLCQGDCDKAKSKFDFLAIEDCRARNLYYEGNKECSHGCLGGGTCVTVCEFDAIHIVNGVAVVDKEKCTACKKCIEICPKHIIDLIPYSAKTVVKCNSTDAGKVVRNACEIGCIGCQMCVKNCPEQTINFENKLAKIDYSGCVQCGVCVEKCPTGAIFAEYEVNTEEKAN